MVAVGSLYLSHTTIFERTRSPKKGVLQKTFQRNASKRVRDCEGLWTLLLFQEGELASWGTACGELGSQSAVTPSGCLSGDVFSRCHQWKKWKVNSGDRWLHGPQRISSLYTCCFSPLRVLPNWCWTLNMKQHNRLFTPGKNWARGPRVTWRSWLELQRLELDWLLVPTSESHSLRR